jgi:hypothetical protein
MPSPKIEFEKQIKFSTNVSIWNQPTKLNHEFSNEKNKTYYSSAGVSSSKKLLNYQLEMSHVAIQIEFGKSVRVEDGEFEIMGKDGDTVFGIYSGYGDLSQKSINLDLILKITGGTGYYSDAQGYLKMKSKIYEPHSSALFFKLDGYIIRDK